MLKITNRAAFDSQIRNWTKGVKATSAEVAKGLAFKMLKLILYKGPQYTGDFVANWNVSVGVPDYTFHSSNQNEAYRARPQKIVAPAQEGDTRAINKALTNATSLPTFKLGQTIWLANGAFHDEPYAVLIEEEKIQFRPENPSGGRLVAKAIQYAQSKYSRISYADAINLSRSGV